MWVPKDKIIYVADTSSRKDETPIMVPENGCSLHIKERRRVFQDIGLKPNGFIGSKKGQESKIIG